MTQQSTAPSPAAPAETRVCPTCGVAKPLDARNFGEQINGGFKWRCRTCMSAKTAEAAARHTRQ